MLIQRKCGCCKKDHPVFKCPEFLIKSPEDHYKFAKKQMCLNCLSNSHFLKACKSVHCCHKCKQRHHTFLHFNTKPSSVETNTVHSNKDGSISLGIDKASNNSSTTLSAAGFTSSKSGVILATAQVEILNKKGFYEKYRVYSTLARKYFLSHERPYKNSD